MPSEPAPRADGDGTLHAANASLQLGLSAARARNADQLPRWFPATRAAGSFTEVLALDGTALFAAETGVAPLHYQHLAEPHRSFWLRHGNPDAWRAFQAASTGETVEFEAAAEPRAGGAAYWTVTMAPLRTSDGVIEALLTVSSAQTSGRPEAPRSPGPAVRHDALPLDPAPSVGPMIGAWLWDVAANRWIADPAMAQALGIDPAGAAAGLPLAEFVAPIAPQDRPAIAAMLARTAREGGPFRAEYRMAGPDGNIRWVLASGRCDLDSAGHPVRFAGVLLDVHDRTATARAEQAQSDRQAALLELADKLLDMSNPAGIASAAAEAVGRVLGVALVAFGEVDRQTGRIAIQREWTNGQQASASEPPRSSSLGPAIARLRPGMPIVEADLDAADWLAPADRESFQAIGINALVNLPLLHDGTLAGAMFVAAAASRAWLQSELRFIHDVGDRARAAIARGRADNAMRASVSEWRQAIDAMPAMIVVIDCALTCHFVNRAGLDWLGMSPDAVIGRPARDVLDAAGLAARHFEQALAGQGASVEAAWPQRDGTPRTVEIRCLPRRDAQGAPDGLQAVVLDITERKRTEQALQASADAVRADLARRTEELDRLCRLSHDIMLVARADGVIEALNPAWTAALGWAGSALVGTKFLDLVHPDDVAAAEVLLGGLADAALPVQCQTRMRHRDGGVRSIAWSATLAHGFIHAAGRDITAEHERDALQHQSAEQQHRPSQQPDPAAISTQRSEPPPPLPLPQEDPQDQQPPPAPPEPFVIAERPAAALQSPGAKPLNINRLLMDIGGGIQRMLGSSIELTTVLGAGLWPTPCDRTEFERALLNLCRNARDAMPAGGRLVIATANAQLDDRAAPQLDLAPGDYVQVSITDSGTGMTSDVAARAIEPSFTTKPAAEGNGQGLSMTHGFARQWGGRMRILTRVGRGTTIQLTLPRHLALSGSGRAGERV